MIFCPTSENFKQFSYKTKCCYGHVEGSFDSLIKETFDKKPKTIQYRSEKKILEAFF